MINGEPQWISFRVNAFKVIKLLFYIPTRVPTPSATTTCIESFTFHVMHYNKPISKTAHIPLLHGPPRDPLESWIYRYFMYKPITLQFFINNNMMQRKTCHTITPLGFKICRFGKKNTNTYNLPSSIFTNILWIKNLCMLSLWPTKCPSTVLSIQYLYLWDALQNLFF